MTVFRIAIVAAAVACLVGSVAPSAFADELPSGQSTAPIFGGAQEVPAEMASGWKTIGPYDTDRRCRQARMNYLEHNPDMEAKRCYFKWPVEWYFDVRKK